MVGEGLRRAARIMERKGERDGSDSMKLAAKAAGAVAGGLAFVTTELSRGEREGGLWAVRPDGEWATLATEKRLRVRGRMRRLTISRRFASSSPSGRTRRRQCGGALRTELW